MECEVEKKDISKVIYSYNQGIQASTLALKRKQHLLIPNNKRINNIDRHLYFGRVISSVNKLTLLFMGALLQIINILYKKIILLLILKLILIWQLKRKHHMVSRHPISKSQCKSKLPVLSCCRLLTECLEQTSDTRELKNSCFQPQTANK